MDFSHSVTTLRDVPVIHLTGAIDLESVPQIRTQLVELVRATGGQVVVDLTGVLFFDSAGLSALDEAQTVSAATGGSIALVCPDPKILRLFTITGLDDRFVISPTVEQAVAQ